MQNVNKNKTRSGFTYLSNYFNINVMFGIVHIILVILGILTLIRNLKNKYIENNLKRLLFKLFI